MSQTPESKPGALVVSSPKALAIANRQLRIAGQALARIEPDDATAFVDAQLEKFRLDLNRYRQAMAAMDPRPIRMGLYFPLLGEWRVVE